MNLDNELYPMIYKRKSFHLFRNIGEESLSEAEIENIYKIYESLVPLCPEIKTAIKIVPASETNWRQGQQYAILMYSEKKDNYLQNIGYLGEQLDLYLVSQNIASLWLGLGRTKEKSYEGLDYVIMIGIAKADGADRFRKDMFQCKRKPLQEIWTGDPIEGVTEIVGFAPSACNSQPWFVEHEDGMLTVYRYKKPGKVGLMIGSIACFMNRIDIGIFLCFLELCLANKGISFEKELLVDEGDDVEKTKVAVYQLND